MRFAPQSEEAISKDASKPEPWTPGIYDFEIAEAADQTSKNGNEMIALTLYVFNRAGDRRVVYDYLLESIGYKLRHAAYTCGLGKNYDTGDLQAVYFHGKTGKLRLSIEPAKDGYPAKNVVRDYVHEEKAGAVSKPTGGGGSLEGDEIPFSVPWQ